ILSELYQDGSVHRCEARLLAGARLRQQRSQYERDPQWRNRLEQAELRGKRTKRAGARGARTVFFLLYYAAHDGLGYRQAVLTKRDAPSKSRLRRMRYE